MVNTCPWQMCFPRPPAGAGRGVCPSAEPGGRKDLRRETLSSWPSGSLTLQRNLSTFNCTQSTHQLPPVLTVHFCCAKTNSPPAHWRKWVPDQAWETVKPALMVASPLTLAPPQSCRLREAPPDPGVFSWRPCPKRQVKRGDHLMGRSSARASRGLLFPALRRKVNVLQ